MHEELFLPGSHKIFVFCANVFFPQELLSGNFPVLDHSVNVFVLLPLALCLSLRFLFSTEISLNYGSAYHIYGAARHLPLTDAAK